MLMPVPWSPTVAVQLDWCLAVLLLSSCHRRHTALSSGLSNPLCHESMTAWGLQIKTTQCSVIARRDAQQSMTIYLTKVIALGRSQMELSSPLHLPLLIKQKNKKYWTKKNTNIRSPNTDGSSKFEFEPSCLILSLFNSDSHPLMTSSSCAKPQFCAGFQALLQEWEWEIKHVNVGETCKTPGGFFLH